MATVADLFLTLGRPYMTANDWAEYSSAAEWCARRGLRGIVGDPLPTMLSGATYSEIQEHPEEFGEHVSRTAYALAMAGTPEGDVLDAEWNRGKA